MTRTHDVTLNEKGYMLAKSVGGELRSGSIQRRMTDPFSKHLSEEGKYAIQELRFDGGAGVYQFDGTHRYMHGENIDTRSGWLRIAPEWQVYGASKDGPEAIASAVTIPTRVEIKPGEAYAAYFSFASPRNVKRCGLLLARDLVSDYSGAGSIGVWIASNVGTPPNPPVTTLSSAPLSLEQPAGFEAWRPYNTWLGDNLVWFEVTLDTAINIEQGWIVVHNTASESVYWAVTTTATGYTCIWDGAAWSTPEVNSSPQFRIKDSSSIDGFVRDLTIYRPLDQERKSCAAVTNKVMVFDPGAGGEWVGGMWVEGKWVNVKDDFAGPVLDLCAFNNHLFAAIGLAGDFWYWDGTPGTSGEGWAQAAAEKAHCFGLHDNLIWKADGPMLKASKDGRTGGWEDAPAAGTIGDSGTPIQAMISHGGKLFCIKPEGVFEISYPEIFPAAGVPPVGNLALDFSSEMTTRGFAIDWLSGLYFPGEHGLFEWKNGILRDVWIERRDTADEILPGTVYEPYSGRFAAAIPTTRGLLLVQSERGVSSSGHPTQLWSHDSSGFHPMMTELAAQGDPCYALMLDSFGEELGLLWWGVGFEIFNTHWPTWTVDTAQTYLPLGISRNNTPSIILSTFSDPDAYELKHWSQVDVHVEQLDLDGTWFEVYATVDGGAEVKLGVTSLDYNGPTTEFAFPEVTTGYSCQLRIVFYPPAQNTYGPRVERVDLYYQPLPDTILQHELLISIKDFPQLHSGGKDPRTAGEQLDDLQLLADATAPFAYVDPWGRTIGTRVMGMVTQVDREREKVPGIDGFSLEALAQMTLLEVGEYTLVEPPDQPPDPPPTNWWDPEGWDLCVWGAWQAKDRPSLNDTYDDLSGNENDITQGAEPAWDIANGWKFDRTTWLSTGYIPPLGQNQSVLVQFTNLVPHDYMYFFGVDGVSWNPAFLLEGDFLGSGVVRYVHGLARDTAPALYAGNLGFAGNQGYRNGTKDGLAIPPDNSGTYGYPCLIGAHHWASQIRKAEIYIQAVVIYSCILTETQMGAIAARMAEI